MNLSKLFLTKLAFTFFVGITLITITHVNAYSLALTEEEKQWIRDNPTVILGADFSWPPFEFDDGKQQHSGLSSDILKLVSKRTGLQFDVRSDKWANIITRMKAGEFDGLACAIKTPEREQYLNFTQAYAQAPLGLFVLDQDQSIQSLNDIISSSKTVAINKGSYLHEWLENHYPNLKLYLTSSNNEAILALSFGKADAYIGNIAVTSYVIAKQYLTNIKLIEKIDGLDTLPAIAISKSQPILYSIMYKTIADISETELYAIHQKWLNASKQKKISLSNEEKEWLKNNPIVKVAGEIDWVPFDFVNEQGEYTGLVNDYLIHIEKISGINFEIETDIWANNIEKLKEKRTDIIPAAYNVPGREAFSQHTIPYFETLSYLFVHTESDIASADTLEDVIVAIPQGYAYINTFRQRYPKAKVLETPTIEEAVKSVIDKKADMVYDSAAVVNFFLKKYGSEDIIPFSSGLSRDLGEVVMLIRPDKPELISIINKSLQAIPTESKKQIRARWISAKRDTSRSRFSLSKKEMEWLLTTPNISYGGKRNNLPLENFNKKGELEGILSEYFNEIFIHTKLNIISSQISEKTNNNPSSQETLTSDNHLNSDYYIVSGYTNDPKLNQNYKPLPPIIETSIVIISRKSDKFVNDLDPKKHSNIVTTEAVSQYLKTHYPNFVFNKKSTVSEALEALSGEQFDIAVLPLNQAAYLIEEGNYIDLKIIGKTSINAQVSLFVNKKEEELYSILLKTVEKINKNKLHDILGKWNTPTFANKNNSILIIKIISLSLLVFLLLAFWLFKLFREIKQRKIAQNSLRLEKENIQMLFDNAADAHLILQKGVFVDCNKSAVDLFKAQNRETLLNTDPYFWSPEYQYDGSKSAEKAPALLHQCVEKGHHRFEWILTNKESKQKNETFWVDIALTTIHYKNEPAIYVAIRDINDKKSLENDLKQNQQQLQLLIDSIPLIIIVTDFSGRIISANQQALDDFKQSLAEISGTLVDKFYTHEEDKKKIEQILKKDSNVHQIIVEMTLPVKGVRSMMTSVIPIKFNSQPALLKIALDITERVETEKLLNQTKISAELANRSKSEFLANMSHEIRTPMNAILGFTELLNEQVHEPQLKSFINTIQSAGNNLLTLINDILDLSKIEAGKLSIENSATDIEILFNDIGNMFMLTTQKKGLDFYVNLDPNIPKSVLIDSSRLRQVVFNLIGNAVKFTEKGYIKLSARMLNVYEHLSKVDLEIIVEDSGIGIPEEQQKNIFNVFEQQPGQSSDKYGGTGLGLSISQRLVNIMGGSISVSSVPEQGATFTILIPKIDIASVHQAHTIRHEKSLTLDNIVFDTANILIVDDVENNRQLIVNNLANTNLNLFEASNGLEAIESVQENAINLILMDIRMPVMDGYEATQRIKKSHPHITIMALTASVMHDDNEAKTREHFDVFLRKPILKKDLFQALSKHLKHSYTGLEDSANNMNYKEKTDTNFKITSQLVDDIKNKLTPLHDTYQKSNSINDINHFIEALNQAANNHDIVPLKTISEELKRKSDSFDISGIQDTLAEYISLSNSIIDMDQS